VSIEQGQKSLSQNERQQQLIERIQEDERLRGDLTDAAATALVEWASRRVASAAADPARPDAEVEADVQAIRAAARAAARSGQEDPQRVLALAEAALAEHAGTAPQTAVADPPKTATVERPTPGAAPPDQAATNPTPAAPSAPAPGEKPGVSASAIAALPSTAPLAHQAATAPKLVEPTRPPAPPVEAPHPHRGAHPPFWRRWRPLARFWNRIRGDR